MNIYIETFGCSANQAETEIMTGLLTRAGINIVNNAKDADIVIINTCSVKSTTEQKIFHKIKEIEKTKNIIIAGCMPESEYEKLRNITDASLVSTHHIKDIASAVEKVADGKHIELIGKKRTEKICLPRIRKNKTINIVPISSGCLSACAYCSTKLAKGELFSYSKGKIIEEISSAKANGFKEFWITAQDCGCYGFDNSENLADLLNNITGVVKGKYFLRAGMLNPRHVLTFLPQLIEAYKNEHVFKFLHLPVQSGSNKILELMGRGYTADEFRKIINEFRKEIPEITVWTDVIVGFPGESDSDFQETISLIKEIKPDFVNISAFGVRPGTKAAKMKQINTETKKKRTREMTEIVDNICLEANKKWLGKECEIIIDEYKPEKQNFIGRNIAYKPIVIKNAKNIKIGNIIKVTITDAEKTHLNGKII